MSRQAETKSVAGQRVHRIRKTNRRNDYNSKGPNRNSNEAHVGMKFLQMLLHSDVNNIIVKIYENKKPFFELLQSKIYNYDMFVLILNVISKFCTSPFENLNLELLLEICNSNFIQNFRIYLLDLSSGKSDGNNDFYWKNEDKFWKNVITFFETITRIAPSIALNKCKSLIYTSTKQCLNELREKHNYNLPEEYDSHIKKIQEQIILYEKKLQDKEKKTLNTKEPSDNFRDLTIWPDHTTILGKRQFLRPNIVEGAYDSVEHYLDVQFRLLREDCFGPLRDGIRQYLEEPSKRRFDNIRVYRNVKFVKPYCSNTSFGAMIQCDKNNTKHFKKIKWEQNKRFLFGSLLIFTKDNFKSFIVATVMERDIKCLENGQVLVSFPVNEKKEIVFNEDFYIMIESEVYFEPYVHALQALQDPRFPDHLAMSKYIVKVDSTPTHPSYLEGRHLAKYVVKTKKSSEVNNILQLEDSEPVLETVNTLVFDILQRETWPTKEELNLNESQYEAYWLALTHEFAVIQGPPGTGKSFIGVKVAETFIRSLRTLNCLMLVICYTNHALDQFLEALLPLTESLVRIGGQSRNKALEKYNISNMRRAHSCYGNKKLFFETKFELEDIARRIQNNQSIIDSQIDGVLSYETIRKYVPEVTVLDNYCYTEEDPLAYWLFEKRFSNKIDFNQILSQIVNSDVQSQKLTENQKSEYTFTLIEAKNIIGHLISKATNDEIVQFQIQDIISRVKLFQDMSEHRNQRSQINIDASNVSRIPTVARWTLYFKWLNFVIKDLKEEIIDLQKSLHVKRKINEELRMLLDAEILKSTKVIGMTTSGAARLQTMLRDVGPPIVLVEEAAEVLEQHIVTSLTKNCKHLILIGDHQQLRPTTAHVRMAKYFNMEISLFERMIMNGIHSRRLNVQHRMRPEIAALITPHIYADLMNHPSVENFPDVRGMTNNLFFLTHNYKEEECDENTSHRNFKEADMVLGLANYIMQQGYNANDVTILAAYSGQMFYMKHQRQNFAHLNGIKIIVVDNYQGEESKIILLSLVRNNDEKRIGFLNNKNRVCVALSRAREGFYIFGNIDILKNDKNGGELWNNIAITLKENNSLGSTLTLKCENHPDAMTSITTATDFNKVPEGGCMKKCGETMPCGHLCPLICHAYDSKHLTIKCYEKCERIICELQHACPLLCLYKCKPCEYLLEKNLPCGHIMKVKCHEDPADVKCTTKVAFTFPDCGHEATKLCYQKVDSLNCKVPCINRVETCGHECTLKCHVKNDPDHEQYVCKKPCARAKKGCTSDLFGNRGEHQCLKQCYETCDDCEVLVLKKRTTCKHSILVACSSNVDENPCRKPCARLLPCGHHCKKKCFEQCGDCKQKVKKIISSCGHEVYIECMNEATRDLCRQKCERILSCGHPCLARCDKICDQTKCTKKIPEHFDSPCGHKVQLPCHEFFLKSIDQLKEKKLLQYCMEPCLQILECKHLCGGTCSQCYQGRLHVPCRQTCHQLLICGHSCEEKCNQVCPPCKKQCEVRCPHSRCNQLCGAPCAPCQEPCKRVCPHGRCDRRCGEPCSISPCNQPCDKKLVCSHPCRGLCGEPCPDICNICLPEEFPKDFLGDDYDDEERFIQLQDCSHVLDLDNLDNLMMSKTETVKIPTCPFCRQPIVTTNRYKDIINRIYKTEINPIKERVYGTKEIIENKKKELRTLIGNFNIIHKQVLKEILIWKDAFIKVQIEFENQKKPSLLQLEMQSIYLDILNIIAEYYTEYKKAHLIDLKDNLDRRIKIICKYLFLNVRKLSQQQQKDIGNEIKRIHAIVLLSKILKYNSNMERSDFPHNFTSINKTITVVVEIILSWRVYEEDKALAAIKKLKEDIKHNVIVNKAERALIVKAIGLKAGSWYKCPNGHFYCIGECGGANQVSKCIECGVSVGGERHQLLPGNTHAGEMDNSQFAAYSEEANNMANFNLDDIL